MPPDEVVSKAYENPIVLYVVIAVLALGLIITAGTNGAGKIGKAMRDWTSGRRRSETEADDADIADLRRQVSYLRAELREVRHYQQQHTTALVEHQGWDTERLAEAGRAGRPIKDPPPLWPPAGSPSAASPAG